MIGTEEQRQLLTICAIRGIDWHLVAREAQRPAGLDRLLSGQLFETSKQAAAATQLLKAAAGSAEDRSRFVQSECALAEGCEARLVTVVDDDYPANLRLIYNLPPFLFYRGELRPDDASSVAVVGTRQASAEGLAQAREIARHLVEHGVTVVAGLALGIDTAAHEAALDAGGRTIAVLGTGITKCYPSQNKDLAEEIARRGALVSQFWPSASPTRASFPMRNVTTSGITQGTIVIEAGPTSGAKMQARLALEHGKRVFLVADLVTKQPWARSYLSRPGAAEIHGAEDVVKWLRTPQRIIELSSGRRQLVLDLA